MMTLIPRHLVSDIAIFVLKRDVKLQPTNLYLVISAANISTTAAEIDNIASWATENNPKLKNLSPRKSSSAITGEET